MKDKISNANFPMDAEGRVYHVGVKSGEVSNRLITVGDPARLHRFKAFLDAEPVPFEKTSARGYTVVTGRYRGVPVSLVAIGMGVAMVDFFVREVRAVTTGELAIIRFGSCGSLLPTLRVGSLGVPEKAVQINTNYDYFHGGSNSTAKGSRPYLVSKPIETDEGLRGALLASLEKSVASPTCTVTNLPLHASADCFYSSQGRLDPAFADHNETLIDELLQQYPECASLEMESAHLLHLAAIAAPLSLPSSAPSAAVAAEEATQTYSPANPPPASALTMAKEDSKSASPSIRAAVVHMVFAARRPSPSPSSSSSSSAAVVPPPTDLPSEAPPPPDEEPQADFIDPAAVARLEPLVGRACLDALVGWSVKGEMEERGTVWAL
ncbi:hypothetical protein JCM10207_007789 [Rhodosporidiobolus poonsookiae]